MIGPDGTPAGLIAHLATLRQLTYVVETAVAVGELTTTMATEMAQCCDQAARATLDLAEVTIVES